MSQVHRVHVPGAFYCVAQRNDPRYPLFSREHDYDVFERALQSSLRRYSGRVHAFCWTPHAVHFVVQIDQAPLAHLMQRLNSLYARQVQHEGDSSGRLFQQRHHAVLIDPDLYLVRAVRYLHYLPALAKLAPTPDDYPHSSHHVYLGMSAAAWVTTSATLRHLRDSYGDSASYQGMMSSGPELDAAQLFQDMGTSAIGSADFLSTLPLAVYPRHSHGSLEQLVQNVASLLGVQQQLVCSPARGRKLTLARAVIAWQAQLRGVASYTEVALRCRRHPSSISAAVDRYRRSQPGLFNPGVLHRFAPLVQGFPRPQAGPFTGERD